MPSPISNQQETLEIDLTVNPKNWKFLQTSKKRCNHLVGSAGSGKSWSVGQFFMLKLLNEQAIRILVTRKTGPALRKSCWLLMIDMLKRHNIPYDTNKTDMIITVGENEMYFVPLDDPDKLKSIEKINYVWCEEATEITQFDYMQVNIRCRGENVNGNNQLYFSYNPVLKAGNKYLYDIARNPPENTSVQHTTYKDNMFLTQEYMDELENLKNIDEVYYQIYAKGLWASPKNIIYTNWDITRKWPTHPSSVGYGLDFGYNQPTALIQMVMCDGELYERELLYQTKLTNEELIGRLKELIPNRRSIIVADSAAPEKITEIRKAGFNIWPCTKGKSSIKIGIDRVKRYKIHVYYSSTNLIEEKETYKWKEDADGHPLDEPVGFKDHLMDAERYYLGEIKHGRPRIKVVGNYF